jgi:hypothetical protein
MWKEGFETGPASGSQNRNRPDPNFDRLLTVGLAFALALFFASSLPLPLVAPVMREILLMYAFATMFVAAVRRDRVFADTVTAWDQAAIFAFLGLLSGFFVDPQAVAEALKQMSG